MITSNGVLTARAHTGAVAPGGQAGGSPVRPIARHPPRASDADPAPGLRDPGDSQVTAEIFRGALARHPAGVAIVTLRGPTGPAGVTVTSFSSASLEPPLVSFYIGHGSSSWPAIRTARHFAINLIGVGQEALAARFARKGEDRFAPPTRWHTGTAGLPLLAGATTHLVCVRHQQVTVGDHELVVGRVIEVSIGQGGDRPLLHHQGQFMKPDGPGHGRSPD